MRLTIGNWTFFGRSPLTIVGGPRLAPFFIIAAIAASAACAAPWSTATANTVVSRYPDPDIFHWPGETNHFSWQAGYMMFVFEKLWRLTGDETYFNYVKKW